MKETKWSLKKYKGIIICFIAMFLIDAGIGVYNLPFVLYLEEISGGVALSGRLLSLTSIAETLFCLYVGKRIKNEIIIKRFLIFGALINAVAQLLFAFGYSSPGYILGSIFVGISYAFVNASMNLTFIRNIPSQSVGLGVGLYTASIACGSSLGSFVSGRLIDIMPYRQVFFVASLFFWVALLVIAFICCPEALPKDEEENNGNKQEKADRLLGPNIWLIGIASGVCYALIIQSYESLFPVFASHSGLDGTRIGQFSGTRMLMAAIMRCTIGFVLLKVSALALNNVSFVFLTLGTVLIPILGVHSPMIMAVIVVAGLSYGIIRVVSATIAVSGDTETATVGRKLSLFSMSQSSGQAIAPFVVGLLADRITVRKAFILIPSVSFVLFAICYLLVILKTARERKSKKQM